MKCKVKSCDSNSKNYKAKGVSLHRFPSIDKERMIKWLKYCGDLNAGDDNKSAVICSKHFSPSQFFFCPQSGKTSLKHNAVPGIDERDYPGKSEAATDEDYSCLLLVDNSIPFESDKNYSCSALNCPSKFMSPLFTTTLRLYRFPLEDANQVRRWADLCGDCNIDYEKRYLCSLHFLGHQYDICPQSGRLFLKENALPMINSIDCQLYPKEMLMIPEPTFDEEKDLKILNGSENRAGSLSLEVSHQDQQHPLLSEPLLNDHPGQTDQPVAKRLKRIHEDHSYALPPLDADKLKRENEVIMAENEKLKGLVKKLQCNVIALQERIASLEKESGKYQRTLSGLTPTAKSLLQNEEINTGRSKFHREYDAKIIDFSLCLAYYSNSAYEFLKKSFTLPSQRLLIGKLAPVECADGFFYKILQQLKEDIISRKKRAECTMSMDEAALKKGVVWDPSEKTYAGYTTVIEGVNDHLPRKEAEKCLAIILKGLDGSWEKTIGYFLTTDKSTGEMLAKLTQKALKVAHEAGAQVRGLACDGPNVNIDMLNKLGAVLDFKAKEGLKHHFVDPASGRRICVFLDTPHMLKLVRNLLGEQGIALEGFEHPASWLYIERLYRYKTETGFRPGIKMSKKHVFFKGHKMKVCYAAQMLSLSVAEALDCLRIDLKHPDFQDSAATAYLCRRVDEAFDILNSRNEKATGLKAPLTKENLAEKIVKLEDFAKFMMTWRCVKNNRLIMYGRRKTCVIGFNATIKSTIELASEMLTRKDDPLVFYCTYYNQQDFLEHKFSRIRQRGGNNDNPDAVQLKYTMRKLNMIQDGGIDPSIHGNCKLLTSAPVPQSIPAGLRQDSDEMLLDESYDSLDQKYVRNCLTYIAGYVADQVIHGVKCTKCIETSMNQPKSVLTPCQLSLLSSPDDPVPSEASQLLQQKNRGGLRVPSGSTCKLVYACEQIFVEEVLSLPVLPCIPNLAQHLAEIVIPKVDLTGLFPTLPAHLIDLDTHISEITKRVTKKYFEVRCKSYVHVYNDGSSDDTSKRNSFVKLLHNIHQ